MNRSREPRCVACGETKRHHPECAELAAQEAARESARVLLSALDVLDAAASGPDAASVLEAVSGAVAAVPEGRLPRVAAALAVECVWGLPPASIVRPRTLGERRLRLAEVRAWLGRRRSEAWRAALGAGRGGV